MQRWPVCGLVTRMEMIKAPTQMTSIKHIPVLRYDMAATFLVETETENLHYRNAIYGDLLLADMV